MNTEKLITALEGRADLSPVQVQEILDTLAGLVEGGDEVRLMVIDNSPKKNLPKELSPDGFLLEVFLPAGPEGRKTTLFPSGGGAFH